MTSAAVPVTSNKLVEPDVSVLFIPSGSMWQHEMQHALHWRSSGCCLLWVGTLCASTCTALHGSGWPESSAQSSRPTSPSLALPLPAVEAIDAATGKACQGTRIPTMTTADIQKASSLLGCSTYAAAAADRACKQHPLTDAAHSPSRSLRSLCTHSLCTHSALRSLCCSLQSVFVEKNPLGPTVGGIYNSCSHNKSRIIMQNSLVAERVRLPCAGNT